jgi:hypothetical protein
MTVADLVELAWTEFDVYRGSGLRLGRVVSGVFSLGPEVNPLAGSPPRGGVPARLLNVDLVIGDAPTADSLQGFLVLRRRETDTEKTLHTLAGEPNEVEIDSFQSAPLPTDFSIHAVRACVVRVRRCGETWLRVAQDAAAGRRDL